MREEVTEEDKRDNEIATRVQSTIERGGRNKETQGAVTLRDRQQENKEISDVARVECEPHIWHVQVGMTENTRREKKGREVIS